MNKEFKDLKKNSQYLLTQMLKKYHRQIKDGKAKHQAISDELMKLYISK